DDGALKPTLAGLMSASGRQRRASAEKTAVGFCAGKIQTKASLGSPRPTIPPPHHRAKNMQPTQTHDV
ncbi:MAG: hypothetical protein WAO89_06100, partial [Kiritimatiellia bacterium]